MAKKKKLNSKNPKYQSADVTKEKVLKEVVINNVNGVLIKAIWYEQNK